MASYPTSSNSLHSYRRPASGSNLNVFDDIHSGHPLVSVTCPSHEHKLLFGTLAIRVEWKDLPHKHGNTYPVCPLPVAAFSKSGERMLEQQRFDRLVSLSPSAKLVFRVLQNDHPLTTKEISERTLLPRRTTRYALEKLNDADLIEERINPQDPRGHLYMPLPVAEKDNR